ncbi:hypothetical protein Q3G72_012922 [Acer saccharum]|nr:hypothetical protein Q3G72_012922 [Acer saccharum]
MGCFDDVVIKTVDNMLYFNYVDADEISLIVLVNWAHNDKYNCNTKHPNLYKVSVRVSWNDEEVRINIESELVLTLEQFVCKGMEKIEFTVLLQLVGNEEEGVRVEQNIIVNQNIATENLTVAGENIAADENVADLGDGEAVDANDIVVDEMFSYVEVDGNIELLEIEEDVVESDDDSDGYLEGYRSNNDELFGKESSKDEYPVQRMGRGLNGSEFKLLPDDIDSKVWCAHTWDTEVKCDHATNNLSEAFNSWIGKLRNQPVLTLLENLRRKVMKRMHKMRTECTRWSTKLPPVVHRTLEKLRQEGRSMQVLSANDFEFEILDEFGMKWLLILDTILMAMVHGNLVTYQPVIHPIPDQRTWPEIPNDKKFPPIAKTKPGQPKVKRRREQGESVGSKVVRCTGCRGLGHNIRSCKKKSESSSKPNKKKGRHTTQHVMNNDPHLSHNISNNTKSLKDRVLTVLMLAGGDHEQTYLNLVRISFFV